MNKHRFGMLVFASLAPLLIGPVNPANLTGSSGALLTDVHNRVDRRQYVDWSRHIWGEPTKAKLGDILPEGTQVGTGDKSWAQISWPKVRTRIWEDSVVAIAPNKKVVYLLDGEMLFTLDKEHKISDNFEIWTKLLQARVHGTTFIAQSSADFCRIAVLEGNLDVMNRLDGSLVNVGPGVIYEVRCGAPPPATWVEQDDNFDLLKKSRLPSLQNPDDGQNRQPPWPQFMSGADGQGSNYNYKPYTPPRTSWGDSSAYPQHKYSDAEIEQKANELSKGDGGKKQYFLEKLHKMNGDNPSGYSTDSSPATQAAPSAGYTHGKHSDAEIEAKAQELSKGDLQQKQHWLEKLHQMNGDSPGSYGQQTASFKQPNYQPEPFTRMTPFVDTSEFAPIQAAKHLPKYTHKGAFVDDLSSHAVPPVSLFRTSKTATNLYLADVTELWKNHLVQGFSEKLPSIPLVESELEKLPKICRLESKFSNKPDLIAQRNSVLAAAAKVLHGPNDKIYEVGREMPDKLTLPGQGRSKAQSKETNNY